MKRLFLLIFSIGLLAVLCLFWFRNPEPYPLCGIAESVTEEKSGVLADIKQWFYKTIDRQPPQEEWRYRMMDFPAEELARLERIFSSYDLKTEGQKSFEDTFVGYACSFIVVGKDGDAHILNMYIKLPESNMDLFLMHKIEYDRDGLWKNSEVEEDRYFVSPKLYGELEEFIKNLPASNPVRQEYEKRHAEYDMLLRDKRQEEKEKN